MRVIAIIPAYNEEKTIGDVLEVVKKTDIVDSIIVVSDGSTDGTVEVARSHGVHVIELKENLGKGGAMSAGMVSSESDIILFLDADLLGLTEAHVRSLVQPVMTGEAEMTLGLFDRGRLATDLALKVAPFLTGQRAVRRSLLEQISDMEISRFGVEVAITRHIEHRGIPVKAVTLHDMSHVMKEEKMGLVKGFAARMKMYWEIVKSLIQLEQFK
jgi:polyisoprenyl-phosphate glycosyltransferase